MVGEGCVIALGIEIGGGFEGGEWPVESELEEQDTECED